VFPAGSDSKLFSRLPTRRDKRLTTFITDKPMFSSERMLCKDYDHKGSVEKGNLVVNLKGLGAMTN
jgi:hypothetical protein